MKKKNTFPILVVESNEYITDVMSRTAEGSFPEAALHFVADDEAALHSLDGAATVIPKLILHGTYLSQTLTNTDTVRWLSAHPIAGTVSHVLLGYSDLPAYVGDIFKMGASTYYPKPEMIVEWASFWSQIRRDWFKHMTSTNASV